MKKVITYGTYDVLHYGHIKLLERAKALGDYLIVGITSDDYDKARGKINVQQSLLERIEAVKSTGLADEIIIEEYQGQKIDDIKRYDIDIFTVGSDWTGKFDYLNEYCKVVYLDRTEGVSSSDIRKKQREIKIGVVGELDVIHKFVNESTYVNGASINAICTRNKQLASKYSDEIECITDDYGTMLQHVDAVYVVSHPKMHYQQIKEALLSGKHVLCESPMALSSGECIELYELAENKQCILSEAIKTAYSTAYSRLLLLVKSGVIGSIVSIDATCTSLRDVDASTEESASWNWNSICSWGPTAMLPIFQIKGTDYKKENIVSCVDESFYDKFTKIDFIYSDAVASIKVGKGVKSEGELIISGTEGYIYVPAPWWKTDYFEVRYENAEENKRYFYQLDGEGIRYEIVAFVRSIESGRANRYIEQKVSECISGVIEKFYSGTDINKI